MKLLLVSQDYPPGTGGVQSYAAALARQLGARHDVTVLAPGWPGQANGVGDAPYRLVRYPIGHTSLFGLTTPLSVALVARRTGARVAFHAQYATAGGSLLARRLGLIDAYYVAAHGRELLRRNLGPPQERLRRAILGEAAGVFPVSRYTGDLARRCGVPAERVHVVPNGVDLDRFQPRPVTATRRRLGLTGRRVVLTAGRLVRRKGVDTTIAAVHRLVVELPNLAYLVVGEGPDRARLRRLAAAGPARDRIHFLGRVGAEALTAYYSAAHAFVMPSREERDGSVEGFGLVFLEANACGTAVIGARSGGVPDAVEDGVSGLLVRPDDPADLAAALRRLLRDTTLRRRLAWQGRDRARRFTWTATADRILARLEADARGGGAA